MFTRVFLEGSILYYNMTTLNLTWSLDRWVFIVFSHVVPPPPGGQNGVSKHGELIQHQQFSVCLSSKDYLDHLSNEEQRRYMEKLQVLATCDPYLAPAAVFEPFLNTSTSKKAYKRTNEMAPLSLPRCLRVSLASPPVCESVCER